MLLPAKRDMTMTLNDECPAYPCAYATQVCHAGCAGALDNIAGLGFERDWFVGVVTSGEVAHQQLLRRPTPFWQNLGRRVLHITWSSRGQVVLDDVLGLQVRLRLPCVLLSLNDGV